MRILHIDDELVYRTLVRKELEFLGHTVVDVGSTQSALDALNRGYFDVALLDLRLRGENGLDSLQVLLGMDAHPEVIVLTGFGTVDVASQAMKIGAFHVLKKPCDQVELELVLAKAYDYAHLRRENDALRMLAVRGRVPPRLIGSSRSIGELDQAVDTAARSDTPILIHGEPGTGKELVAGLVHSRSKRAHKPFVSVRCSAVQGRSLASELFGDTYGATSSTNAETIALIEAAEGGTLYLDQIAAVPMPVQKALLRVLESGEMQPVGGSKPKFVNVRLICGTDKQFRGNLSAKIHSSLYHQVSAVELHTPPLRDHLEDIPDLVSGFLVEITSAGHIQSVDPEVYELFRNYHWPRNVRELRNVIERAVMLCKGTTLMPSDLPSLSGGPAHSADGYTVPLPLSLAEMERIHTQRMLDHFRGNKTLTAAALGVTRKTLYKKLGEYGASPTQ